MSDNDYPEKLLKGAPNKDAFDQANNVMQYSAWEKWDSSEKKEGYEESSVNWFDCDDALIELKNKLTDRKGEMHKQFIGCFILSTEELRNCIGRYEKLLDFGRHPLEGNPYHGNIYRKKDIPKLTRITLMSQLCNAFIEFVAFDDEQS